MPHAPSRRHPASSPRSRSHVHARSHLRELEKKHARLERAIRDESSHPSSSDHAVRRLKRAKLELKREIERMKRQAV